MSIQKIIPFMTPIWSFNIGASFDKDVATCYAIQSQTPSVSRSNEGGYQSPHFNFLDKFPELVNQLSPNINGVIADSGLNVAFDNAWININKKWNYNVAHIHPNSALSGVLYLKTNPNSGKIVFENPTGLSAFHLIDSTLPNFFGEYSFVPNVGDVLLFPSYLRHYVLQNTSDEDRVSIAFNLA